MLREKQDSLSSARVSFLQPHSAASLLCWQTCCSIDDRLVPLIGNLSSHVSLSLQSSQGHIFLFFLAALARLLQTWSESCATAAMAANQPSSALGSDCSRVELRKAAASPGLAFAAARSSSKCWGHSVGLRQCVRSSSCSCPVCAPNFLLPRQLHQQLQGHEHVL